MLASILDRGRRVVTRRRALVMADQAASSSSNVVVVVLVARSFETTGPFGAFSLAMVAYQLALGVVRAMVGEPLLSLYSARPPEVRRPLIADLQGATLLLGAIGSLGLWGLSLMLGDLAGEALGALAIVLPLLLVQDSWRYLFVIDRPGAALVLDLVWLAAVAIVIPQAPDEAGVGWFVVAWGLGGWLGGVVGAVLSGWSGRLHPWRWLVDHRATSLRFLGETTTAQALGHLLLTALGAIAGLPALGAARATQVFYGPLNTLHMGVYLAVVPEGAALRDQPWRLHRRLTAVSAALAAVVAGWMAVGLVLPDRWGRALFGPTWEDAGQLMLPLGLASVASAIMSGGLLGLRSLGDARRSLKARLRVTPWLAACPLVGTVLADARGFAVGTAVGTSVAAVIWWATFRAASAAVVRRQLGLLSSR